MLRRLGHLTGITTLALALVPSASAQCVTLGTPGVTGCNSINGLSPSIDCNGTTPNIGNSGFSISGINFQQAPWATPCGVQAPPVVYLLVGPCAASPTPVPCGTAPFCNGTFVITVAYVDYFAFQVLLAPGVLPSFPFGSPIWSVPIPNSAGLIGATLCAQALQGVFTTLPAGCLQPPVFTCFAVSNGLQITVLP